ncbi:MAG: hypothetical protein IPK72_00585 [Candidatus Eisenbacteria bacterium]|nr:hypothetical protein [Candidatus Eisenbacteria bacterium]
METGGSNEIRLLGSASGGGRHVDVVRVGAERLFAVDGVERIDLGGGARAIAARGEGGDAPAGDREDKNVIAALETVPDTVPVIAPSPLSTSFATDDLDPRITLHPSEIHHVWIASRRYRYVGLIAGLILDAVVIHNRPRFDFSTGS